MIHGRHQTVSRELGRYHLITRIGAGGMAEVFLARQSGMESFNKLVIIKTIHQHLAANPQFSAMLVNEARLAAQINHRNVVDIYDVGCEDGTYFIAMEYVRGHSLIELIRKGRRTRKLDVYSTARVVAAAACGLDAAHNYRSLTGEALEFVHRDVSPGNIIVGYDGSVKLVDFGVSKARGQLSHVGKLPGKLGYAAPEQLEGRLVDRRADIFGLGVVLWEMLTHRRLLKVETRGEALSALDDWNPLPPSRLRPETPRELDAICLRALERDPRKRYSNAEMMRRELSEFLRAANYYPDSRAISDYMDAMFADERRDLERRVSEMLTEKKSNAAALRVVHVRSLLRGEDDAEPEVDPEPEPEAEPEAAGTESDVITSAVPEPMPAIDTEVVAPLDAPSGIDEDDDDAVTRIDQRSPHVFREKTIVDEQQALRPAVPLKKLLWAACIGVGALLVVVVALAVRGRSGAAGKTEPQPPSSVALRAPAASPGPAPSAALARDGEDVAPAADVAHPPPSPEPEPAAAEPEAEPEPEPVAAEPEPAAAEPEPAPEPAAAKPKPQPKAAPAPKPRPPKRDRHTARRLYREGIRQTAGGQLNAAKKKLREALRADPRFAAAHRALAVIHERQGARRAALREYRRYLRLAPRARDAALVKKRIASIAR